MKINRNLIITVQNQNDFENLTEVSGSVDVRQGATFTAPALTEVSGSVYVRQGATFTAPALTKSGSVDVQEGATFTAPALTVSGSVYVRQGATFTAPALTKSGYVDVREGATFTAPALTIKNSVAVFGKSKNKLNVVHNDGMMFIVESEKTSKGIKILSGLHSIKIIDSKVNGISGFLVSKESFSAHGETVKKAISDLQFKLVAEKLKKEPITPDTIITDNYYRLITGACELGVKEWRNRHGITQEEITAKELLPILEKSNAYGLSRFKEMLKF